MKEEEKEREEDRETMPEQTLNSERNEKNQEIKTDSKFEKTNTNEKDENNPIILPNSKFFRFCDYISFKITCSKKNKHLGIFEDFRKKVISVENLMQNYLKINNLLKLEKRRSILSCKNK